MEEILIRKKMEFSKAFEDVQRALANTEDLSKKAMQELTEAKIRLNKSISDLGKYEQKLREVSHV